MDFLKIIKPKFIFIISFLFLMIWGIWGRLSGVEISDSPIAFTVNKYWWVFLVLFNLIFSILISVLVGLVLWVLRKLKLRW